MARYYACGLDGIIETMIPAAVRRGAGLKQEKLLAIARKRAADELAALEKRAPAQAKLEQILRAWRAMRFDLGGKVLTGASFSVGIAEAPTTPGNAATLLTERLAAHVAVDFDTARRLFTLVCALHQRI